MAESASADTSLSAGSEIVYDIVCRPCSSEGKNVEAVGYCLNCCEYLCTNCIGYHRKFSISKHHNLLDKENMPEKQGTAQVMDVCTERCQIHRQEIIKYYCPAHKVLGCSVCVTLKHTLCKDVAYIPEAVSGLEDSQDYKEFTAKLEGLVQKSKNTTKLAEESKRRSSDCQTKAIQEIKIYRQEVIDTLDRQVNEIKDRARQTNAEDSDRMNTLADKSNQVLAELKCMSSDFSTLLSKKLYCQMFIEMKAKKQNLAALRGKLEGMDGAEVSEYKFQPDEEFQTMVRRKDGLGTLVMRSSGNIRPTTTVKSPNEVNKKKMKSAVRDIKQTKATHVLDINAQSIENTFDQITGLALMSTDKLAVADYAKCTIKIADTANKIISELKTEDRPWGVIVSRDKIVATLPFASKILFLKYDNRLVHDRDVSVAGRCRDIACYDDKLFVIFDREQKLEIMTMKGVVLQRFETNDEGGQLFENLNYVTVSATNQSIYVSEWKKGQVKILSLDGKLKGVYDDVKLRRPGQLAIDQAGVMYLCDELNHKVHLLSPQCTKVKILLTNQDGVFYPMSVCYCENTGRLYVGSGTSNTIKVYQVS